MLPSFRVTAEYFEIYSNNAGPTGFPTFPVQLLVSGRGRSPNDFGAIAFLWDTAASFCTIDRRTARDRGISFDEILDRVDGGMDGLGGNKDAWLTTMRVQFPPMKSGRRLLGFGEPITLSYEFDFSVLVVEEVGQPLLGIADVVRNFTVTSTWDSCYFQLNADHLGEPIAEGATP